MFDPSTLPTAVLRGVVLGCVALAWVIVLVRLIGTRALSKMTAFDFVVTLATGSLLATAASSSTPTSFVQAISAMAALLLGQALLAFLRQRSTRFKNLIDNEPLLVMREGRFLDGALRSSRVARSDVLAKLREAGIADPVTVAAVILETTGDVSILSDPPESELLSSVRQDGRP